MISIYNRLDQNSKLWQKQLVKMLKKDLHISQILLRLKLI